MKIDGIKVRRVWRVHPVEVIHPDKTKFKKSKRKNWKSRTNNNGNS